METRFQTEIKIEKPLRWDKVPQDSIVSKRHQIRVPFPHINEEGRSQLILPKNGKRSAMPGRGDGKRNGKHMTQLITDWRSEILY